VKTVLSLLLSLAVAVPAMAGSGDRDVTKLPGYFDFGDVSRYGDGERNVEVFLEQPLLSLAVAILKREEPEMADLIVDLALVKVNVFSFDGDDHDEMLTSIDDLTGALDGDGWQRLVKMKDREERVSFYVKSSGDGEVIHGVAVLAIDGEQRARDNEAVFVNIVGEFDLEAIVHLIEHFDVPHMSELDGFDYSRRDRRDDGGENDTDPDPGH
jgi:hypothetical protein